MGYVYRTVVITLLRDSYVKFIVFQCRTKLGAIGSLKRGVVSTAYDEMKVVDVFPITTTLFLPGDV